MMPSVLRTTTGALALAVVGVLSASPCARAEAAGIEPEAARLLKRMTDYLGGLQQFSVDAENWLEDVTFSGEKIQYGFSSSIVVQCPNKLRAERTFYRSNQYFIYDGDTLTVFNPQEKVYASAPAPSTIDDLLHYARDTLDIVPPVGDMVFTNAYELLTAGVSSGRVVAQVLVGGVECHHLAFTGPLVDWQVWIADGDEPLPYRYVLTTKDDPAFPQYEVSMSNWNTAPDVGPDRFDFTPPQDAIEIEFIQTGMNPAESN